MEFEELFVEIKSHPNYIVSNYGRVINIVRGTDLKPKGRKGFHVHVTLYNDGVGTHKQIHQLVAEAFFVDWEPGLEVFHISKDFEDNSVRNLTLGNYVWSI